MAEELSKNPFVGLFSSLKEAEEYRRKHQLLTSYTEVSGTLLSEDASVSDDDMCMLEDILLITTCPSSRNKPLIFIPESPPLNSENFSMALFERLLVLEPEKLLVGPYDSKAKGTTDKCVEKKVVPYLFGVYERCCKVKNEKKTFLVEKIKESVVGNVVTAQLQPDLYGDQDTVQQFMQLMLLNLHDSSCLQAMINSITEECKKQNIVSLSVFQKVLQAVQKRLSSAMLLGVEWPVVRIIEFYAANSFLAPLLLEIPRDSSGRSYQNTVLGSLLSISCVPSGLGQKFEFFEKPSSLNPQTLKAMESSVHISLSAIQKVLFKIFHSLLKLSPEVRNMTLLWIEKCLQVNSGRAGLWQLEASALEATAFVCDVFMINLGAVLLELSLPFIEDITQQKSCEFRVLKVNPTYCSLAAAARAHQLQGCFPADLHKQTPLIPHPESPEEAYPSIEELPKQYTFITTCFFLTHRAINLGIQFAQQKLFKVYQDLARIRSEAEEIAGQNSPAAELLRNHMENKTTHFFCLRAAIFEPTVTDNCFKFLSATAVWMVQLATHPREADSSIRYREVPLSVLVEEEKKVSADLQNIPEFLAENVIEMVLAVRQFNKDVLQFIGDSVLHHIISFITVFMGTPDWMYNPHLRAHLAECLSALLPYNERTGLLPCVEESLFISHPLVSYLPAAIIHVFVSIEMTGQSVQFEQKFNYRRPMYEVMKYLWSKPSHRQAFVSLANEALSNMEAASPPLFLRFVNLLINDGIFLLDEGLSYMSQLREHTRERDQGNWTQLPAPQRAERQRNLHQMALMARFHNMLGSRTIQTLNMLTKEMPGMFTHSTLVDRMAAMLNYFLVHLVGPKQRDLKVKDMEQYEFRPGEIVHDISMIYTHLAKCENFLGAVSGDGRSYTSELFGQATSVLRRIGHSILAEELDDIGKKVAVAGKRRQEQEDLAAFAPEEFLDPIMSHLMVDPVILPSSHVRVDRQTIARHLLSDQTDPFSRHPLTMEQVIPDCELKQRINDWLEAERAKVQLKSADMPRRRFLESILISKFPCFNLAVFELIGLPFRPLDDMTPKWPPVFDIWRAHLDDLFSSICCVLCLLV